MSVTLRKKKISGSRESLYLDIYQDSTRKYEFLDIYLLPKDTFNNKEKIRLAEAIRSKRELQIKNEEYGFLGKINLGSDFFQYMKDFISGYKKKDIGKYKGSLKQLRRFYGKATLPCNKIHESDIERFKDYLNENFASDTAYDYLKVFKRIIGFAVKDKLFKSNPSEEIKNRNIDSSKLKKDYLLPGEFKKLINTPCKNDQVSKAYITTYYTGLRGCDVRCLRWREIKHKENIIQLDQNKTDVRVTIDLNNTLLKIFSNPGKPDDLVFKLTETLKPINKILTAWGNESGIGKHVTFHTGRHSFASNLIRQGVDLITVKELMGLRSLRMLEKYAHADRKTKRAAIKKLKEFKMPK